jgi:hypothetical protein
VQSLGRVSVAAATTVHGIRAAAATIPNKARELPQAPDIVNSSLIFVSDLIVSDKRFKKLDFLRAKGFLLSSWIRAEPPNIVSESPFFSKVSTTRA